MATIRDDQTTRPATDMGTDRRGPMSVLQYDDLETRCVKMIRALMVASLDETIELAWNHELALRNSIGAREWDSYVSARNIYGLPGSRERHGRVSEMKHPFTVEQVNTLTTALTRPLIETRELLYVEPTGPSGRRRASVREQLFDLTLNSPENSRAELFYRTNRDVLIYSRGYFRVDYVRRTKYRTVYSYEEPGAEYGPLWNALAPMFGVSPDEKVRVETYAPTIDFEGVVYTPLPFNTVHVDRSANLSSRSRYQICELEMSRDEILDLGATLFTGTDDEELTPTSEIVDEALATGSEQAQKANPVQLPAEDTAQRLVPASRWYEPGVVYEFRGEDPLEDPAYDWIVWILNGKLIGRTRWRGSGPCMNLVPFMWDPINGYALSAGPAMVLLRDQEKLDLLSACELDGALYASHPTLAVLWNAFRSWKDIQNVGPGDVVGKTMPGNAIEEITVGRYSQAVPELIDKTEARARVATAGVTSLTGAPQSGVDTATEFAGVSRAAVSRVGMQSEINFDTGIRLMERLTRAAWRDNLSDDEQLRERLGDDPDVQGATLEDLDGEMPVMVMGPRYRVMSYQEAQALMQLYNTLAADPEARDQFDMDKLRLDLSQAITRRAVRWQRTAEEAEAARAERLQREAEMQQMAATQGQSARPRGQPSPPRPVPVQPADVMGGM